MKHHAYVYVGERETGLLEVRAFAKKTLGLSGMDNPDIAVFEYSLFSVDDARRVTAFSAQSSVSGGTRLIAIAVGRIFHEAQNALLKLFEEPNEGTVLVLIIPAEGLLLPTLRSRLVPLPSEHAVEVLSEDARAFLEASKTEREKLVTKLVARSKSDKEVEKQAARLAAVDLVYGITRAAYAKRRGCEGKEAQELDALLDDLSRFAPILHERSAPLKLIFEHLLLVLPASLSK